MTSVPYSPDERSITKKKKREEKRSKKKRMRVSGKRVLALKRLIDEKSKKEGS